MFTLQVSLEAQEVQEHQVYLEVLGELGNPDLAGPLDSLERQEPLVYTV